MMHTHTRAGSELRVDSGDGATVPSRAGLLLLVSQLRMDGRVDERSTELVSGRVSKCVCVCVCVCVCEQMNQ